MPEDKQPIPETVPVKPEPPKEEKDDLQVVEEPTAQDSVEPEKPKKVTNTNFLSKAKTWFLSNKKVSIPAAVLVLLIIILAVPVTRYKSLGLVYKKNFVISAYDTTANTPVSGANVMADGVSAITDGSGKATLRLAVGPHRFTITKKYYQDKSFSAVVPIFREKNVPNMGVVATGRQVKINIKNTITKKAVANVGISISDIVANTDKDGNATIVLPANLTAEPATLSLVGYNDTKVTVKISNTTVMENDFTITPAGKIYFISKRTGALSIMKADYDGANVQTVLAGTGSEEISSTELLQSADGKYIAYLAKRAASDTTAQLYIISAADDKLLSVDTGNASFFIQGWMGSNLIYTVARNDVNYWQAGKYKLKSYAADTGKTTLLDQSSAVGDSAAYGYESFYSVVLLKNTVVYTKTWSGYSGQGSSLIESKTASFNTIDPSGANHKILATYPGLDAVQTSQNGPNLVNIWQQEYTSGANHYFSFGLGSSITAIDSLTSDKFYAGNAGYILSSDQGRSLWSESVDGKNTIKVGDSSGSSSTTIQSVSSYSALGWAGDGYVLLTKNNSELYITSSAGGEVLKVTDYQPTTVF